MKKNTIKFSCADFTFPLLPHDKVLKLIKLLGINAVDLGIFEDRSHHYPSQIAKDPVAAGKKITSRLSKLSLEAADVFLQTGADPPLAAINTPDKTIRDHNRHIFLKTLDFALTLGCRHVTGLPGVLHPGENFDDDWQRACEETRWRTETAKTQNIVYAVEAHVGSILPDVATTLKFINNCPGLTLTLDYGHFIYQGQPNESVHALIPYTSHFHARGGAKEKLQTTVKENEIDFKTIMPLLRKSGYAGFVCLEYVYVDWEGCNRTDNVSETIQLLTLLEEAAGA